MKKFILAIFITLSIFVLSGCNFNFNFSGCGYLKIENEGLDPIRAIVAYQDGEEVYRMDGLYKDEDGIVGECNIAVGKSETYEWDAGTYDIWLFTYYKTDGYWYYCIKEDVSIYMSSTTTVTLNEGETTPLVPAKVPSYMYKNLTAVVKESL